MFCKLLAIALSLFASYAAADCPNGFVRHGNYCYHFSHDIENWNGARTMCTVLDSYLAQPYTSQEGAYLATQAKLNHRNYWIGGNDLAVEGDWMWAYAKVTVTDTNWLPRRNVYKRENCAFIRFDGMWEDALCDTSKEYFICQKGYTNVTVEGTVAPQPIG